MHVSYLQIIFLHLIDRAFSRLIFKSTGTKLLLNVRLNRLLQVTRQSDKMLQLVCVNYADLQNTNATATIGTFLIKTKTSEVSFTALLYCLLLFSHILRNISTHCDEL